MDQTVADVMEGKGYGSIVSIVFELEDILVHILSNLSTKELDRVARVNWTWYQIAKKIKQNRKQIVWCYYNKLEPGGVEKQIGQVFDNLTSEPHFALIFVLWNLEKKISVPSLFSRSGTRCLPRAVKREEITFSSYMERTLPPSCHLAGIVTDKIVATRFLSNRTVQLEDGTSSSCLFFPKLNGIDIYHFMLGDNFGNSGVNKKSLSAETGIPEDKTPKLILLFQSVDDHWSAKTFCSTILKNYGNVVIAGGYVDSLFTDSTFKLQNQKKYFGYEPPHLGVAFCGSDLLVASVVIRENKNNEKLVEEELSRLKSAHVPEKCSIAFLFCSNSRLDGQFFADKGNVELVELKTFRKLFPDVPLFGFFGDAEIGFDHIPGIAGRPRRNTSAAVDYSKTKFLHEESAIFVILYFP